MGRGGTLTRVGARGGLGGRDVERYRLGLDLLEKRGERACLLRGLGGCRLVVVGPARLRLGCGRGCDLLVGRAFRLGIRRGLLLTGGAGRRLGRDLGLGGGLDRASCGLGRAGLRRYLLEDTGYAAAGRALVCLVRGGRLFIVLARVARDVVSLGGNGCPCLVVHICRELHGPLGGFLRRRLFLDGLLLRGLDQLGAHGLEAALPALPGLALAALAAGLLAALRRARTGRLERAVPLLLAQDGDVEAPALEGRELHEVGQRLEERLRALVPERLGRDLLLGQRLERARRKRLLADADGLAQQLVEVELVGRRELHGAVGVLCFCHGSSSSAPVRGASFAFPRLTR